MKTHRFFFDKRDQLLIELVDSFLHARHSGHAVPQIDTNLHPHGIVDLEMPYSMRIAHAVMALIDRLHDGLMLERLQALSRLYDEVLHCARSSLRHNTGRVLIQLMKMLVRSQDHEERLRLAHDFHSAAQGTPRIIRALLKRYYLLEMPEAWNQQTFDHHVHDANTKGKKTPTHLVMDAWIKGIRFLTVMYYNCVEPEAAEELLQAANIMGITVRIGIVFRTVFKGRFVDITWVPLGCDSPEQFADFLGQEAVIQLMEEYRPASVWIRQHTLALLEAWNTRLAGAMADELGIPCPPAIAPEEFVRSVGYRQVRAIHLAEYIYAHIAPSLRQKELDSRRALEETVDEGQAGDLHALLRQIGNTTPDGIAEKWLSPAMNPDIVFPDRPNADMPGIVLNAPETLISRLTALHPGQIILHLLALSPLDVLELLWQTRGAITHLELFNLRAWHKGRLPNLEAINSLQYLINEGSLPSLKHHVQDLLRLEHFAPDEAGEARKKLFDSVLRNLPQLQGFYSQSPLGARIGTDSTSKSHHTHGMGFAFVETLPKHVQRTLGERDANRLFLPVHTDIYRYVRYHERNGHATGQGVMGILRHMPGLRDIGSQRVHGWGLEKRTTRIQQRGNLVTLGGVNPEGVGHQFHTPHAKNAAHGFWAQASYLNTSALNAVKIACGFLPAQWAFWYTDSWWFLTFFGACVWFFITGLRNVFQAILAGGGFTRNTLLAHNKYISWERIADSLLYTGISVPLLEVVVRLWFLENFLGVTTRDHAGIVYAVLALVNSFYISGHNIFRGFPKEAVIGNLFRSALAIPLSVVYGHMLFYALCFSSIQDPMYIIQICAAVIAKCASDSVAAVIEGLADRNMHIRLRAWDYASKFHQIFNGIERNEQLFPYINIVQSLNKPRKLYKLLSEKNAVAARKTVIDMLDMMYFWYYQPRAQQVFIEYIQSLSQEERNIIFRMHAFLYLKREISTIFLQKLIGNDFSKALSFYLQNHKEYLSILAKIQVRSGS